MSLSKKLARLANAGPGSKAPSPEPEKPVVVEAPPVEESAVVAAPIDDEKAARLAALRARIAGLTAKARDKAVEEQAQARVRRDAGLEALPFAREETPYGPLYVRVKRYPVTQRHGAVPLHAALEASGDAVATLCLDRALLAFHAPGALYLDTETTGLAGGTGTLAFLVGVAWFEGRELCVEQLFLSEPYAERALLERLADRIENATALVTYNGKAFDMPLLRSRYVLSRRSPPREPPHVDLVHASRRVYGARVEGCRLVTLEREVLGFEREGDVPSGEIPLRYANYLRQGLAEPLVAVVEHNLWDVIAMAALLGELSARADGVESPGRFVASDRAGLAKTADRAGASGLAVSLAEEALVQSAREGDAEVAVRAGALAAKLHRRKGDSLATQRALRGALEAAPDDPAVHLSLAKLYEHKLRDPERALTHALRAHGAEDRDVLEKRVKRLRERLKKTPMRLPGLE